MREHVLQWVSAAPLWGDYTPTPERLRRPALLRLASDDFMDDLGALLDEHPSKLRDLVADFRSYGNPAPGPPPDPPPVPPPIKLYQPIHGHFNLVTASLVCQLAGLPDHAVDPGKDEQVGFVLRRLRAADGAPDKELAWVAAAQSKSGKGWKELADARVVDPDEEVFPLVPMSFTLDGKSRRLFVGLVPTSSRETLEAAPVVAPGDDDDLTPATDGDPRFAEAKQRILDPLRALTTPPASVFGAASADAAAELDAREKEASLFLLLDLADVLYTHLRPVFDAIHDGAALPAGDAAIPLRDALASGTLVAGGGTATWAAALKDVWDRRAALVSGGAHTLAYDVRASTLDAATLSARIEAALAGHPVPAGAPPAGAAAQPNLVPKLGARAGTRYVLRCVYQRPRCGALHQDAVSAASDPFTIASFFDPDAPARPIRIPLPVDTSIAGLRKFPRGVGFVLSDELRKQMSRVVDLKKVMDGKLGDGESVDLGVICSFSIPIITICALMVLMIFLSLLNIVFWWMPFLETCFPVKLKAAK